MTNQFTHDVFLSHSAKDKAGVRPLAERLRQDGRQGKAECRRQKAEVGIHPSSFSLHPFLRAFGSDRAQLDAGTCGRGNLPFRDPLNQERPFIPLRLDDAPIKGSLAVAQGSRMGIGEPQEMLKNGRKPVKHIVFAGERFDVMSVRRWRERVLGGK